MDRLETALATTGYDFALYAWDKAPEGDYGVISLDSADDFISNNRHSEIALNVFVDYFTRDATLTPKETIESVLNNYAFNLRSVQFEYDTGYIHYEWEVKLYGKVEV